MSNINLESLDHRQYILVKNARQNNLQNIDLAIPQNQFIVITGVSGSGKSSLAFNTLYAEGQRRYIESLSAYVRQFMGKINKPEVDYIKGLAPAIAIKQKVNTSNPRSTVGTTTEIYDYLKLLYARIGKTFSPVSGQEVKKHTIRDIENFVHQLTTRTPFQVVAPLIKPEERSWKDEFSVILQKGFARVLIDGQTIKVEELVNYLKNNNGGDLNALFGDQQPDFNNTYLIIDRLKLKENDTDNDSRIVDSIQTALFEGYGNCIIETYDKHKQPHWYHFNNKFELDGVIFEEPSVNLFTFNNPYGACPTCEGFGQTIGIDEDKVVPDKTLSIYEGAVACWRGDKMSQWNKEFMKKAAKLDFPIHRPYYELTSKEKALLWKGYRDLKGIYNFFNYLEKKSYKIQYRVLMARYKGKTTCPDCEGKRLRKETTYIKINDHAITDLINMPISQLNEFLQNLSLDDHDAQIAKRILTEIQVRSQLLMDVGLNYLTLNRPSSTLSGGETQRIQLVTSLGSNLTGSLYILDEPSVGLHPRDNARLVKVLKNLQVLGNTVVVVEHDEEIIRSADHLIDIGPLAGHEGGAVIFDGNLEELEESSESLTGQYLKNELKVPLPENRKKPNDFIKIIGAYKHNLKSIDVQIPLNAFSVVTGISGSGKSTLVSEVLHPSLKPSNNSNVKADPKNCHNITLDQKKLTRVEYVDQNPLGKSSRSNPVTYLKAFDPIRELFADQPLAKVNGYTPAYFSFNVDGGRCENCKGEGYVTVEMQFMADIHLLCEECNGQRYKDQILQVTYQDKHIADVLNMTVKEAVAFFKDHPTITNQLKPLSDVGLDYLRLGQASINLSGGEAQRIKLASYLTKSASDDPILFIFDEPTTGLHFHDINNLLKAFRALIENGHTVLVVEHNLEIIKSADWIVDLGPEGGGEGGYVVHQGSPEGLTEKEDSFTGRYLKEKLNREMVNQ